MKFVSTQSLRNEIFQALQTCRASTLDLFHDINHQTFTQQAHPDFSPMGWHLGHIAFTENHWILERCSGQSSIYPQYCRLFAADGLPKAERQNLPSLSIVQEYLEAVRERVIAYLETAPLAKQERLWRWLIQHESQHSETITFILQLLRWHSGDYLVLNLSTPQASCPVPDVSDMIEIPVGKFEIGSNATEAIDNERPTGHVSLETYWIDRYPVTCTQYRKFMHAGGYQNSQWWSEAGWKWLQANPVSQPLYWSNSPDWDHHPVCGVSWYEAQAYACFVGKRLPTEAEWEAAASPGSSRYPWGDTPPSAKLCNYNTLVGHTTPVNAYPAGQSIYGCYDMLGNVWEWTASPFAGYPGFQSYPYQGYSQVYFDNQHQVMRGGSWATRPWALRKSCRNWYHPWVRQVLVGFRCAKDRV